MKILSFNPVKSPISKKPRKYYLMCYVDAQQLAVSCDEIESQECCTINRLPLKEDIEANCGSDEVYLGYIEFEA